MEFRAETLANGFSVLAECNPSAHSVSLGMFVRAGARDESAEIGGVSHFLEHMVFKGTPTRSAEEVNRELDDMGSYSNARTGEESTIYHSTVLPEFQTAVVELLGDLMRPSLRPDDFEMEKKVIIEEILMYQDQPPYGGYERLMADYFDQHPLAQSVLGTPESVGEMSAEQMLAYFQQRYSPNNMALVACGHVDFDKLVADAQRVSDSWQPMEVGRTRPASAGSGGFDVLHKPQSTQQYVLQLCPAPATEDPERYACRVLSVIYGADSGSRMFWEFLDSGMAEAAGAGTYEYQGTGVLMNFLCCDPAQAQENLQRLRKLQEQLCEQGCTARELELAQRKISAHIILGSEKPGNRLFAVGSKWLNGQPYESVAEAAQHYADVTLDQVNAVARKYPMTAGRTLVVGPREDLVAAT